MVKKLVIALVVLQALAVVSFAAAETPVDTRAEIHITKDGKISVWGAKVTQIIGSTIFARPVWGPAFIRLMIRLKDSTAITRYYGESISLSDIKVGDYLSLEGDMEPSDNMMVVIVDKIKNLSILTESSKMVSGAVSEIAATTPNTFFLLTNGGEIITVNAADAADFKKGSLSVGIGSLNVGDKITLAQGPYDHATKILRAQKIMVYVDTSKFKPKNFQGILKSVSASTLPATMILTIEGKDYTVKVTEKTKILNKNWRKVSFGRFVAGDTVRVYGAIQEADNLLIDNVTVVRNIDI